MMPLRAESRAFADARPVNWRGRSGKYYALVPESLEHFALAAAELYLVARGNLVLWVGSAADVIADPQSRSRFRLALDCADRVFSAGSAANEGEHMTKVWDLEGAEPVLGFAT